MSTLTRTLLAAGIAAAMGQPVAAQNEQWKQYRPSNTGIPGLQLQFATLAPDGKLWVTGRWPSWGEGGIGIYDPQTDLWETLSNVDTPQPSQWVNEIVFDAQGAAWIATDDGLARKSGTQWTIYTTANAPFLHNKINDVAIAPNGHIWVNNSGPNTSNAAIFEFDGITWRRFQVGTEIPFALPWNQLSDIVITPDGHIWITNVTVFGVAEYDGTTWTLRGDAVGRFGSGIVDQAGDLWFVAGTGGGNRFWRYRRQANAWDQYNSTNTPFVSTTVTRLAMDAAGRILCGNWIGQIIRFDGTSWQQIANVGDAAYGICPAPGGDLWVATLGNSGAGAVHHLDAAGQPIRRYTSFNTGAPDYTVDGFNLDRQGNLWLASGTGGLSRFDGARWRNWGAYNYGSEPYPFVGNTRMGAFYQQADGTAWMGGNGIARWDPASGQIMGFWNWQNNPALGVTVITSFAQDGAGTLFAASTYGTIHRFNGTMWGTENILTPGGNYDYAGVKSDPQGRVWSLGGSKVWLWDGAVWADVGQSWDIEGKGGVAAYDIAADGTLYLGTAEGLLRVQNPPAGPATFFTPANSPLPAKQVRGIDIRSDGAIALSSHESMATTPFPSGVAVIRGDITAAANWRTYRYGVDPIPHYQLGPVKWDGAGNLWISAISEGCAVLLNSACQANCDASTTPPVLNVLDFSCFLNRFAAGDPYANCDGSTTPPVLNVLDFGCFLNRFAAGCP